MPWSFALPQGVFTSPLLAVATPIIGGTTTALLVNRNNTQSTYRELRQPPFSPPGWLFGPAWTLLYGLMGYASHHATTTASRSLSMAVHDANANAQTLYTTQLALNFLWMPLFFGVGRPAAALGDMALLAGNVALLLANWWSADRTAFWLMTPYAAWLGYATYLNAGVGYLNGWRLPGKKRSE
ncbi:uncharacterized protein N7484_003231 [Penicillium longicatenatum]|uniref:uncharacterized protein n=1 Tax=Penicillium longicatenatum TaxID=1561947 RepID=UPI002548CFBB|nr:uncharacterized protein N7484_003231 [Penicillium longicatenatum]KAJ5649508.1 hypothetical protein N7484_003231 [Penicillium longicatenatum]KAJ5672983.1 hypothetical protein N7507_002110 [Penicillium longicatenatum]